MSYRSIDAGSVDQFGCKDETGEWISMRNGIPIRHTAREPVTPAVEPRGLSALKKADPFGDPLVFAVMIDGESFRSIGKRLGCDPATALRRFHRKLRQLRDGLDGGDTAGSPARLPRPRPSSGSRSLSAAAR